VSEVSGTYQLQPGDALFAWLMPIATRIEMVGVSAIVPPGVRARLLDELRAAEPGSRDRGGQAHVVHRLLAEAVAHAPLPKLANTDGEDLIFCKAYFDLADPAAAGEALRRVPDLEADGDSFRWIGPSTTGGLGATVSLGRIELDGGTLVLESNSRERLERGKRLLAEYAGSCIKHRADSIQSTESLLRDSPRGDSPRDEVPAEVQAEVIGQFLREHYGTWADVSLPALAGKTPRQASKSKRGRAKVRALLDDIEQDTLRQPGGETVDFGALRRSLGLEEGELSVGYEPSRTPDPREWLAMTEDARLAAIEAYHRLQPVHPPVPNPRMHAMVHLIVENQAALGQPAEAGEALERLQKTGLTRHVAMHAVGAIVAEGMWEVLREERGIDRHGLAERLRQLGPGDHAGSAP
jgi:Domain of unknown function (DUF1841)